MYPIKKKLDMFPIFKGFKTKVRIKCLRTDNGEEYIDGDFIKFCKQEVIQKQFTVAYTPQQNVVAKRMNMTLLKNKTYVENYRINQVFLGRSS